MKESMFRNLKIGCYVLLSILAVAPTTGLASAPETQAKERVVLVHGLGRTRSSMWLLSARLEDAGYEVFRIGYHSLRDDPETIRKDVARQMMLAAQTMLALPTLWVTLWAGWLFVPIWIKQNPPILDGLSCWEHLAMEQKWSTI